MKGNIDAVSITDITNSSFLKWNHNRTADGYTIIELYRDKGLEIYEKSHYSHGEHIDEVEKILSWYTPRNTRVLDVGCSGGLHILEFAKRGFSVTGVDIEPSAIELAKKRSSDGGQSWNTDFYTVDIENDDLSVFGKFDLIYSIGNVLSHVNKDRFLDAVSKIRECLALNGLFLFDVLTSMKPFKKKIMSDKNGLNIRWKRTIDEVTGRISMDGIFPDFGYTQHFDVWGYTIEEVVGALESSGFRDIEISEKLDFLTTSTKDVTGYMKEEMAEAPVSLYFIARV